jgi:UDP-glucose:(heptosyl)LPS alpha-1,3-glucosyltransferase
MQKVAVIIPKYGLVGGAEQFVAELTNRLSRAAQYDFHVFANNWQAAQPDIAFHKIPIISFPKFLTTPSFAFFACQQMAQHKFDLIHSHERIFNADIFTMHGIPHRYWVHNIRRKKMSLYDLATDWVEKRLVYYGNCRKFIAVSNLTRDIFLNQYNIDPRKVIVIHPGIDLNDYRQEDNVRALIRAEYNIKAGESVIVFASMNFEIKGLDRILLAVAKLKKQNHKFKLIIAGKGNKNKYTNLAREAQILSDVIFTGQVTKEKLLQIYSAGDMYIMLSKFDTFGMVVLEAMAAGLPVIISDKVGAKDVIEEGTNGYIISDTKDDDYIAAKISQMLDENIRRQMGEAARFTARLNTWDHVVDQYKNIYSEIIDEKKK